MSGAPQPEVSWAGVGSAALGALLLALSHSWNREAEYIANATQVEDLAALAGLLKNGLVLPAVIALDRATTASANPITARLSGVQAVMVKTKERIEGFEHRRGQEPTSASRNHRTIVESNSWELSDGSRHITVQAPERAERFLPWQLTRSQYIPMADSKSALAAGIEAAIDLLMQSSFKAHGRRIDEYVVPLGQSVSAVGELALIANGTNAASGAMKMPGTKDGTVIAIRAPGVKSAAKGHPLIITSDLDALRSSLAGMSKYMRWTGTGCLVLGLGLTIFKVWNYYKKWREWRKGEQERQERMLETFHADAADGQQGPLPANATCSICMEHAVSSVFVPCGHMCACYPCAVRCANCPICRRRGSAVRVFAS